MSTPVFVDERPVLPERGWPGGRCRPAVLWVSLLLTTWTIGCGGGDDPPPDASGPEVGPDSGRIDARTDAGADVPDGRVNSPDVSGVPDASPDADQPPLPYATGVESYEIGDNGGYGDEQMPDVVLGPPDGAGGTSQGLQVLSLGEGGTIVLTFDHTIVDGEGADFIVFENPFYTNSSSGGVYQELGEVSVSADGETWKTFDCDTEPAESGRWPGCAGWRPVEDYDPREVLPLEPAITGGDPFDLEDVGLEEVRYVRIHGISSEGYSPKVGFDLDAVGIIHAEPAVGEP